MLARKSLLIFLTNVVGGLFGLVGLFAIGRYMGPEPLGVLAYTLGIVGIVSFVGNMGLDAAHVKRVSEGGRLGDKLATFAGIKALLATVFAVGVLVSLALWDRAQGLVDTSMTVVVVVVVYFFAFILRMVPAQTFNGLKFAAKAQTMILVEHLLKNPIIVVVALVYGAVNGDWVPFDDLADRMAAVFGVVGPLSETQGAVLLGGAYAFALVGSLLGGVVLLWRHEYPWGGFRKDVARDYLRYALPIAVVSAFATLSMHLDSFMIGYFWSSADVGYYFAARRITTTALIIPTAVGTMFFPLISQLAVQGQDDAVVKTARSTQHYMSLVVVLVVMFMVMFPHEGIHIFLSNDFFPAALPLQLMAVWTLLIAFTTVAANIVKGYDRPKAVAKAGTVSLIANVSMNILFIPDSFFGVPMLGMRAAGAALATVLAQVIQLVLLLVLTRKVLGRTYIGPSVVKHLGAAALTMGIMHLAADLPVFGGLDRVWELAGMGVFGTMVYLLILIVVRDIGRKDWLMLIDMVSPGKMARYIHDEVRSGKDRRRE